MSNIGKLKAELTADSTKFKAGVKDAINSSETFKQKMQSTFNGGLSSSLDGITSRLGGMSGGFGELASSIAGVGGIAGATVGALVAVTGAIAAIAMKGAESAREIENLSRVAGATPVEFQKMAAGAKVFGIEQDKLSDQLKDFREKTGEFLNTGAGPMKDFFENIAPKVGVTAEQFRKLSGPQALQLYYDSLQKAGVSQEEMSWYLESMGSDLTALSPLLKDGGALLKQIGTEAENAGAILDDKFIDSARELRVQMDLIKSTMNGVVIDIQQTFIPAVASIAREFQLAQAAGSGFWQTLSQVINAPSGVSNKGRIELLNEEIATQERLIKNAPNDYLKQQSEERLAVLRKQVAAMQGITARTEGIANAPTAPPTSGTFVPPPKEPKKPKAPKAVEDALADEAKAYAQIMDQLNSAYNTAATSGQNYTAAQNAMLEIMRSPEWAGMPDHWKQTAIQLGETVIAQEKLAIDAQWLNSIIAATPSSKIAEAEQNIIKLGKAYADGKITAQQFNEAAVQIAESTFGMSSTVSEQMTAMQQIGVTAAQDLGQAFMDFASNSDQSFGDFAASFLKKIAMMIIQVQMFNALSKLGGAMTSSSNGLISGIGGALVNAFGTTAASASGNVFTGTASGPRLIPFANGGVFDKPMTFPMANNRRGLAFESGPEAIMPLERIGGKLGVNASGLGGTSVTNIVQVTVEGGDDPDATGQKIGEAVIRAIANQEIQKATRTGGILNGVKR